MKTTPLIELKDTTFIIPVRIESSDREFNFLRVIQFLCDNFDTNIIITESDKTMKCLDLLHKIKNKGTTDIRYRFIETQDEIFHRTRLLNEMLNLVKTPVTVNYDIDVFMEPQAYVIARDTITLQKYDLVYPYKQGAEIQKRVDFPNKESYDGHNLFDPIYHTPWQTYCGHCQFFNTESYINGGMENENFESYGAEDHERGERFIKMGYKVIWLEACIYHMEHTRGVNSSPSNPKFFDNENLMLYLRGMTKEELHAYYAAAAYLIRYKKS